jgi:hypothetical protein
MASTEEKSLAKGPGAEGVWPGGGPMSERRRRAHELLSAQRSQLDRLEVDLAEQLQNLADEVAESVRLAEAASGQPGEAAAVAALQVQLEAVQRQLAALEVETERQRGELEQAQLARGRAEQELRVRDALLKEAQSHEEASRVELASFRERAADAEAQLNAARERHAALERELTQEREQLAAEREETKAQRRRIARELKRERAELQAEADSRANAGDAVAAGRVQELEAGLAAAQTELLANIRELDELREKAASGASDSGPLRHELASLGDENAALRAELEAARVEHARELERLASERGASAEVAKLEEERDALVKRLAAAESGLAARARSDESDSKQHEDLQRRFEMAVEEVRELKRANADLENKLKARGTAPASPALGGGGLDWEAQKQRLLASLEADDVDENDEEAVAERTSIEGTIRITDEIVAQKDQELAELRRQMEQQGGPGGSSAAAAAELLDRDEIIRQEREKLAQAQAEWREKIGRAEIDVSVERAKIARERAELEEKIRQFQVDQDRAAANTDAADPSKPGRGRWLARLGLKDLEDQK